MKKLFVIVLLLTGAHLSGSDCSPSYIFKELESVEAPYKEPTTQLFTAIQNYDPQQAKICLEKGALNNVTSAGVTPLELTLQELTTARRQQVIEESRYGTDDRLSKKINALEKILFSLIGENGYYNNHQPLIPKPRQKNNLSFYEREATFELFSAIKENDVAATKDLLQKGALVHVAYDYPNAPTILEEAFSNYEKVKKPTDLASAQEIIKLLLATPISFDPITEETYTREMKHFKAAFSKPYCYPSPTPPTSAYHEYTLSPLCKAALENNKKRVNLLLACGEYADTQEGWQPIFAHLSRQEGAAPILKLLQTSKKNYFEREKHEAQMLKTLKAQFRKAISCDDLGTVLEILYAQNRTEKSLSSLFSQESHPLLSTALQNKKKERFRIMDVLTKFEQKLDADTRATINSDYYPLVDSPLIKAAKRGDADAVTYFLKNPYFLDEERLKEITTTALFDSLAFDEKTVQQEKEFPDPHATIIPSTSTENIYTALQSLYNCSYTIEEDKDLLQHAVHNGSLFQVNFFLAHGMTLKKNEPEVEKAFFDSESKATIEILRRLLETGMTFGNDWYDNSLNKAAEADKEWLVEYFLSCPPPYKACHQKNIASLLRDTDEYSSSYKITNPHIRHLLLKKLTCPNTESFRFLLDPTLYDDPSFIEHLLQQGAYASSIITSDDDPLYEKPRGTTPAHVAAQTNHPGILALFAQYHAPLDSPDSEGFTPLLRALKNNASEAARFLIQQGASVITTPIDDPSRTSLSIATEHLNLPLVTLLLHHQNMPTKVKIDALFSSIYRCDFDRGYPYCLAMANNETEKRFYQAFITEFLASIPSATASHETINLYLGRNPANFIKRGIKKLTDHGFTISSNQDLSKLEETSDTQFPLHELAKKRPLALKTALGLLTKGANPLHQDDEGRTALEIAQTTQKHVHEKINPMALLLAKHVEREEK